MDAEALSRIDLEKPNETIQANFIQAIVAATITGLVANHIEAIPCSPQTIGALLPSIPDTPAVSKATTQSSRQSYLTCMEAESSILKAVSRPDDCSHLGDDNDSSLNPKCMTTIDWVEAQTRDKLIGKII